MAVASGFGRLSTSCLAFLYVRLPRVATVTTHKTYALSFSVTRLSSNAHNSDQGWGHARRSVAIGTFGPFAAALTFFSKKEEKTEDPVVFRLKKGILAQRKGEFKDAEAHYHEALSKGLEQYEAKKLDDRRWLLMRINIYDLLGNLAMQAGNLDDAEKLYKEVIRCCLQHGLEKDDDAVIELSVKLASIYAMQKRVKEADEGYRFCIDAVRSKVKNVGGVSDAETNSLALLGVSVQGYARFMMSQKKYADAKKYFEDALDVASEIYGREHPQTLVVLNDVGAAAMLAGNYADAAKYFGEAMETAERSNDAGGLPAFRCNLAVACLQNGEFDKANDLCLEVLHAAKEAGDKALVRQAELCLQDVKAKRAETAKK